MKGTIIVRVKVSYKMVPKKRHQLLFNYVKGDNYYLNDHYPSSALELAGIEV